MANAIVETAQSYAYSIIVGVVILLIGFGVGILAKKIILKILHEIELNRIMRKVGITQNLEKAVSVIVSYVIYLITIVLFLRELGIDSVVLYLVLGGVLTLIILTFLVGLKDVIPNFMGGLMICRKGNLKEGKNIEIKEIRGTIEKIGYLETEIQTPHGDILYVPNALFMRKKFKVKNH
jgi:small-conductance mechanosensitive channel